MDRFDDIWNNRFNSEDLPSEEWSMPDDKVWSSISQEISIEEKKRPWWMFWLTGLVLLIVTVCVLGLKIDKDEVSELSRPVVSSASISQVVSDEKDAQPTNKVQDLTEEIKSAETYKIKEARNTPKVKESEKATKIQKTFFRSINRQGPKESVNFFSIKSKTIFSSSEVKDSFNKPAINKGQVKTGINLVSQNNLEKEKNDFKTLLPLTLLKGLVLPKVDQNLDLSEKLKLNSYNKQLNTDLSNKHFNLSVNAGLQFWSHKVSETYLGDLSPFEFTHTDNTGWTAGLNLEYEISKKISLFLHPNYEQVITSSGHNSNLEYKLNEEQENSNNYNLNLATPFGFSEADFFLLRLSDISENNVDLLVDFTSEHTIRNIALPLGIKVNLFDVKRLNAFVTLGGAVNHILEIKNSIKNIHTNHSAFVYQNQGTSSYMKADVNKWHFDVRAGLGLDYSLLDNLKISLAYNYIKGLNPIFELNDYKTKVDRNQFQIGVLISRF